MRLPSRTAALLTLAILATSATAAAAPANNDIADATPIEEGVERPFSTVEADDEPTEDYCDGYNTVWFSFTAPAAGDYLAYATGADHDTEIGWNDDLTTATGDCPDDSNDSYDAVEIAMTLAEGEQEYVQMGVNSDDYTGTGGVGVVAIDAAADGFADATILSLRDGAPTAVAGVLLDGATIEVGESTVCGSRTMSDGSGWLEFTPPTAGTWMIEAKSTDSLDLAVYTGASVDDLTLLQCATTDRRAVLVDLDPSTTYRIRVADSGTNEIVVRAEPAQVPMVAEQAMAGEVSNELDVVVIDGEPAIVHEDDLGDLMVTIRVDGVWQSEIIDASGGGDLDADVNPAGGLTAAYHRGSELRFVEQVDGVWTVTTVDTGISNRATLPWLPDVAPSHIHTSAGNPVIAYHDQLTGELRVAERVAGTWNVTTVDADGDGASTDVGAHPALVEHADGRLGVVYADENFSTVRYAERADGVWTDTSAFETDNGDDQIVIGAEIVAGEIVFATIDNGGAYHHVGRGDGSIWTVEQVLSDRALAELDWACGIGDLMVDPTDTVFIVWQDCNYAGTIAIHEELPGGGWTTYDAIGAIHDPSSAAHGGSIAAWEADNIGVTWLPDGRMAIAFQESNDGALIYAEDALIADAGPAIVDTAATDLQLDGSASSDAWGTIVSYAWSDVPAGCSLSSAWSATPTLRCVRAAEGTMTLTVTDTDGFTHTDKVAVAVDAAVCPGGTVASFDDVDGSSYAADDIACLRLLEVTTGTSSSTYSPHELVTREQLAAFLARMYESIVGEPALIADHPFTDVDSDRYSADDIARMYGLGITNGTSATTYAPDEHVTREQLAAMLGRFFRAD